MAIVAKRYQFLNQETSVASSSFKSTSDSSVLNSSSNEVKEAPASAVGLMDSVKQKGVDLLKKTVTKPEEATRSVKSFTGRIVDLKILDKKNLDGFISEVSGADAGTSKALSDMLNRCSARGMGYGLPGRPNDATLSCGSGKLGVKTGSAANGGASGCDAGNMSGLLNKMSGGNYNNGFSDINKILQKIMSFSGLGYNLGLCGVWNIVTEKFGVGASKASLSKANGGLLGLMASGSKTNAFLDLSKGSSGLTPLSYMPGVAGKFLDNYKNPSNVGSNAFSGTFDRVYGGLSLLDEKWMKGSSESSYSLASVTKYGPDLTGIAKASAASSKVSLSNLNAVPSGDSFFVAGAMAAMA